MVEHPLGLVEVAGGLGPVLVVGPKPTCPLAGGLAGEQPGEPGGPDVRRFPGTWQRGTSGGDDWGQKRASLPVYRAARVALNGLLSAVCSVHSLASISLPDTAAMTLSSFLDWTILVLRSP